MPVDYNAYGLHAEKVAHVPGKKPKDWWCLWCNSSVTRGFYLCFQNWCICEHCVMEMADRARTGQFHTVPDQWCFKCDQRGRLGYPTHPDVGTALHICPECLAWAAETLFPEDAPAVQGRLFTAPSPAG